MRTLRYVSLAAFFGVMLGLVVWADDKGRPPPAVQPQGKIVVKPATELRRLATPVTTPTPAPTPRPGHRWHWHQGYGTWVLLPVNAYPQVVLPVTYQLPVQVSVYQATATSCQLICPHCGQPVTVEIR